MSEETQNTSDEPQDDGGTATAVSEESTSEAIEKEAEGAAVPDEPLFEADELRQFDQDDVTAGKAICKMLSLFFFYTVIVMAIAGAWTAAVVFD